MEVASLSVEVVVAEVLLLVVVQSRPGELSNIPSFFAVEVIHAPQSVCAKDDAKANMLSMLVTLDTSHFDMSQLNDDALENMRFIFFTLDTSHLEMSLLNDDAEANMNSILTTLETSHLEMSPLNASAF